MASIKLVLRSNQQDQTGKSPLYIRIIKDRKTKFIAAGLKLKESDWDEAKQRVKKSYPNSARMNAALAQKIADAEAQIADMERKVKSISVRKLKEAIKGKDVPNFFDYSTKYLARIKGNKSLSTYNNYDLLINKFKNWEEKRIKKVIHKTGRLHQFKIGQIAFDIITKYINEDSNPEDLIFNVIPNTELFLRSEEYRYEMIKSKNHSANFQLKRIAKKLKIETPVSFHVSRHSFATNALNNGMRIEHVSKLMDHNDISTTQVYAKIISEELDKAVDNYIY